MPRLCFNNAIPVSADVVWKSYREPEILRAVSKPILNLIPVGHLPSEFAQGQTVHFRLSLFGFIPWGKHSIYFATMDNAKRSFETQEFGTNIQSWNHHLIVQPISQSSCVCLDVIDFEAGVWNVILWPYAQLLYRWRYRQRSRLLRNP